MWNSFNKFGLKTGSLIISADVAAKTLNPQLASVTSIILEYKTGGIFLSLTDMHGIG